jgi:hypothetical protein
MYSLLTSESQDPRRATAARFLKVGLAVSVGFGFGVVAIFTCTPAIHAAGAAEETALIGMPTSSSLRSSAKGASPVLPKSLADIPGPSPWKELALAGIESANSCGRDVSTNAQNSKLQSVLASMDGKSKSVFASAMAAAAGKAKDMPGAIGPLGFWDPMGFTTDLPEGRLAFLREVELKHGRLCMLASAGFFMGETFHPFYNDHGLPAIAQLQDTDLVGFWWGLALAVSIPEAFYVTRFTEPPDGPQKYSLLRALSDDFTVKTDGIPGDLGFDPLGMKPKDAAGLKTIQEKELSNGRLAMIAAAGMIAQEMVTGEKIFR